MATDTTPTPSTPPIGGSRRVVRRDSTELGSLLVEACSSGQPVTAESLFARAWREFAAGRHADAVPLLWSAAERGHAAAQYVLGCMHQLGQGGLAADAAKAAALFTRAAAAGDAPA